MSNDDNAGGFQVHSNVKKQNKRPRIYVGNIRTGPELKSKLVHFFREFHIRQDDIDLHKSNKSCFALIVCRDVDRAVRKMNGKEMDGRKLVVQREKKSSKRDKGAFGGGGWSGPTKQSGQADPDAGAATQKQTGVAIPTDKQATAAHSLVMGAATATGRADQVGDQSEPNVKDEITLSAFVSRCKQPLSQLLDEYGEHDPDFRNVIPTEEPTPGSEGRNNQNAQSESSLGQHGKASIHVELRSFGYTHQAPSNQGWSHSHPIPAIDARSFPPVPPYMLRQDGLSPHVKRELLTPEVKQMTKRLGEEILDAIVEAIRDGYGHAMPLRMTIHVGSESGRHRSVVLCEATAVALRSLLRKNEHNRVTQTVSVGTFHQDIDRRSQQQQQTSFNMNKNRSKQNQYEDDW